MREALRTNTSECACPFPWKDQDSEESELCGDCSTYTEVYSLAHTIFLLQPPFPNIYAIPIILNWREYQILLAQRESSEY